MVPRHAGEPPVRQSRGERVTGGVRNILVADCHERTGINVVEY